VNSTRYLPPCCRSLSKSFSRSWPYFAITPSTKAFYQHHNSILSIQSILVLTSLVRGTRFERPSCTQMLFRPIDQSSTYRSSRKSLRRSSPSRWRRTLRLTIFFLSGFRKGHSTETLLLRLLSDVYEAIYRSQLTLLALFDVSAAFDTEDHEILLEWLNISFGFSGTLLLWLKSFLSERSFCVVHGTSRSLPLWSSTRLCVGTSPSHYTSDLASFLASHAVLAQLYADAVQAYQHCLTSSTTATVRTMSNWA